ncbi:chloramphenicol acetyltransferase [Lewinellaceae bacterium SD302]|nr:chloramphenicol acetyltransferase [Lewinellaceae bacterium SD302]
MKQITFTHPHKQKHFDFFRAMDQPHFGITANVDITDFLQLVRERADLRFTPCIVYLIARAAQEIAVFRWRIRGEQVVEHEMVRPSFAVPTAAGAFSFCTVNYYEDPFKFHKETEERMELMKTQPSFEDEEGADDYLFLSTFPWASFTNVKHAMNYRPEPDSVPRIVWGKYFNQGDKVMMPLAVQAHHAVVDGSDLGAYYRKIQQLLKKSSKIFALK